MATLIVRNVDEGVKARLMRRAAENGHSMEAEARSILKTAVEGPTWIAEWLERAPGFAGAALDLPQRSAPRELGLFGEEG